MILDDSLIAIILTPYLLLSISERNIPVASDPPRSRLARGSLTRLHASLTHRMSISRETHDCAP